MSVFCCPVCGKELQIAGKTYRCPAGHSFDVARQGYVNLLCTQQSSAKRHGDDKVMLHARRRFLEKGYYQPLLDVICAQLCQVCPAEATVLDAGCGDGWYLSGVTEALTANGTEVTPAGVDISRDAAAMTARRLPTAEAAVASVYRLPVADGRCDVVLNLFSPSAWDEYQRVLKPGGFLLRAVPLRRHLMGLKEALYENPLENEEEESSPEGWEETGQFDLRYAMNIEGGDIPDLFMMTPYYYKTGAEDQRKLEGLTELYTEIQFRLQIFRKTDE